MKVFTTDKIRNVVLLGQFQITTKGHCYVTELPVVNYSTDLFL